MGTRGIVGFYRNGITKVAYNHFDSYPSELGYNVRKYLENKTYAGMVADFDRIRMVTDRSEDPTPELVISLFNFWYGQVDTDELIFAGIRSDLCDWYSVLRDCQGDLDAYARVGFMEDSESFLKDSLFCEWGYIINLGNNNRTAPALEIYRGFQNKKPDKNRYAMTRQEIAEMKAEKKNHYGKHAKESYYFNCDLISCIPVEDLTDFDMDLYEDLIRYAEDVSEVDHVGRIIPMELFGSGMVKSVYLPATLAVFGYTTTEFKLAKIPWFDDSDKVYLEYANPTNGECKLFEISKFFPDPKPVMSEGFRGMRSRAHS